MVLQQLNNISDQYLHELHPKQVQDQYIFLIVMIQWEIYQIHITIQERLWIYALLQVNIIMVTRELMEEEIYNYLDQLISNRR